MGARARVGARRLAILASPPSLIRRPDRHRRHGCPLRPVGSLQAFQERVLGGGQVAVHHAAAALVGRANRAPGFAAAGMKAEHFRGYYLDRVTVPRGSLPHSAARAGGDAAAAVADAAGRGGRHSRCELVSEALLRAGVFIGIGLDLNTTNFHLRWSLLNQAREWDRQLGLDLSSEELAEWTRQLRDAAGPPLTANRTMGALGSIVASRIAREFRLGGPSFTVSQRRNVRPARPAGGGAVTATGRTGPGRRRRRRSGRRRSRRAGDARRPAYSLPRGSHRCPARPTAAWSAKVRPLSC